MGNQGSKEKTKDGLKVPGADGPSLENSPSFSKADTKDSSSRSLRGTIKSKIPASISKIDSPRTSTSGLGANLATKNSFNDGSDSPNLHDGSSHRGASPAPSRSISNLEVPPRGSLDNRSMTENLIPPPSPSQSASLGHGHHDIDAAQRAGEISNLSDAPPSAANHPSALDQPGESILIKPDTTGVGAIEKFLTLAEGTSTSAMELSSLKTVDLDDMITRLLDAGYTGKVTKSVCLKNAEITAVCQAARELFLSQPALIELTPPVKIVGDIHGQYTDLLRLFEMCGFPPKSNFLFLGDYVDRGKQSLETILLLMCYKLKYPENFFLLRGNHESANVTRVYGFYDECKRRTNVKIWKTFIDAFNTLPIASIVANKIFCVHGGLSPQLKHMDDIRRIQRPTDVPDYGLLNDLLWSDPADIQGDWESNERGVSYCFGKNVILQFLQTHDFDLVCRAHMVVEDGYEFFNDRILVTVFSAPNYCGEFDNWGAVMAVSAELLCSFELLKPLDSSALKTHIKKARTSRLNMINSPPASQYAQSV